jgi:hypothetical protein
MRTNTHFVEADARPAIPPDASTLYAVLMNALDKVGCVQHARGKKNLTGWALFSMRAARKI